MHPFGKFVLIALVLCFQIHSSSLLAQEKAKQGQAIKRPKLVVGIVIDQMRYDFLYRYWRYYGQGGFKRMVEKGFSFENTHYHFAPTVTGPGHASIYTGSAPAFHGIAGNNWYDRATGKTIYCTSDSSVTSVGAPANEAGQMSPRNLLTSTLGDELKTATNYQAKVIGIALKDRGAILPAGRAANAAYWLEGKSGNWITSTYYMPQLPAWVTAFNTERVIDAYAKATWQPLLTADAYAACATPDSSPYESELVRGAGTRLPQDISRYFKGDYDLVRRTPFGNKLTTDFAIATLVGEQLGTRPDITDMLCVSYSSTDYVGHLFGPSSVEIMDTYLKLDRDLARLLDELDTRLGKNNYLVFLSADHGISDIPAYATSKGISAGRYTSSDLAKTLNEGLKAYFNKENLVSYVTDEQVYLNEKLILEQGLDFTAVATRTARLAEKLNYVSMAFTRQELSQAAAGNPFARRLQLGCNPARSGDVFLQVKSGYIDATQTKGTTHSSTWEYDTHVPLLFYGWKISRGTSSSPVEVSDIAPTVSTLLKMLAPSGNLGQPILQLYGK
jgi:hypothetical protein